MARAPRNVLPPAGIYHVTTRGVDGCAIYRDDDDRRQFLRIFALAVRRHDWDVHVFCLMGNHYHFVVETGLDALSRGMQLLNGTHALDSTAAGRAPAISSATASPAGWSATTSTSPRPSATCSTTPSARASSTAPRGPGVPNALGKRTFVRVRPRG